MHSDIFYSLALPIFEILSENTSYKTTCFKIINKIKSYFNSPSIFTCSFSNEINTFSLSVQENVSEQHIHCQCNSSFDTYILDYKKPFPWCVDLVNNEGISYHPITEKNISFFSCDIDFKTNNYYLVHVPLISSSSRFGVLHLIVDYDQLIFILERQSFFLILSNLVASNLHNIKLSLRLQKYEDNFDYIVREKNKELLLHDAQLLKKGRNLYSVQLLNNISERLSNHLEGISLIAQALLTSIEKDKINKYFFIKKLNDLVNEAQKSELIINSISKITSVENLERHKISIEPILRKIFKILGKNLLANNISLELDIEKDLPDIWSQESELEQIFVDLLDNAQYALSEAEEALFLSLEITPENKTWQKSISVKAYSKDDLVNIEFSDNGIGIKKDDKNKIFRPFFTTKKKKSSVGISLSLMYDNIKGMGGDILIESEYTVGTKVTIKFPIYKEVEEL